jgi:hypothetical protein
MSRFPNPNLFPKNYDEFVNSSCTDYKLADLKDIAENLGLSKAGKKQDICDRIENHFRDNKNSNKAPLEESESEEENDNEVTICGRSTREILDILNEQLVFENPENWTLKEIRAMLRDEYDIDCSDDKNAIRDLVKANMPRQKSLSPPKKTLFSDEVQVTEIPSSDQQQSIKRESRSEELDQVDEQQLQDLSDNCMSLTRVKINEQLKKWGVSRLKDKSLAKLKKEEVCNLIKSSSRASSRGLLRENSSYDEFQSPQRPISPKQLSPSRSINKSPAGPKCNTAATRVVELVDYIKKQGWPMPSSKNRTKAKLCEYIEQMEEPVEEEKEEKEPIKNVGVDTSKYNIEDLDNCAKSRKLTKAKIQEFSDQFGFTENKPKPAASKGDWCDWFSEQINNSKQPMRKRVSISQTCGTQDNWNDPDSVYDDFSCKEGKICDVDKKSCVSRNSSMTERNLDVNGKNIRIYGKKSSIDNITNKLSDLKSSDQDLGNNIRPPSFNPNAKSTCGDLEIGTKEEIIENLSCPSNQGCDISTKKCVTVKSGMASIIYNGKLVTGKASDLEDLRIKMENETPSDDEEKKDDEEDEFPISPPLDVEDQVGYNHLTNEESESDNEDIIDFGNEDIEESAESIERSKKAQSELNALLGIKEPISNIPSKNEIIPEEPKREPFKSFSLVPPPEPKKPIEKVNIETSKQTQSYVERIGSRLRNIQSSSQSMPVRVVNEMNKISEKAQFCAGLSS